jgi:hypothetical protein
MVSFKKFANIKLGNIIMDSWKNWFNDYYKDTPTWERPNLYEGMIPAEHTYDIELGNLIGKQVVEAEGNYVPRTLQKIEVKYYKDGKLVHEEIGCLYKYKYSKGIGLENQNSNDTYSFHVGIN